MTFDTRHRRTLGYFVWFSTMVSLSFFAIVALHLLLSFHILCASGFVAIHPTSPIDGSFLRRQRKVASTKASTDSGLSNSAVVEPTSKPWLPRGIRRLEKFSRLPVWPAWNGAFIWLVGVVFGYNIAAELEQAITGRVCPNFYAYSETSPFIMLVHHCHSFSIGDPLRFFQRTFFPEGFPAHPHRGFVTITYILHGGFVHRDSEGVKQSYGAEARHNGKHTQWLTTGRGMLHEEMFDISGGSSRQELFQIWLNVPARHKFDTPETLLLGGDEETPTVVEENISTTRILAGCYRGKTASAPVLSDLSLFHVTLEKGASWTCDLPTYHETAFLYVRKGTLQNASGGNNDDGGDIIPVHNTAYFAATGSGVRVTAAGSKGADFMFLSGAPLREPCVASGSMVMTSSREIDEAFADYQMGKFGQPWDHNLSDGEWQQHVKQTRSTATTGTRTNGRPLR